MKKSIITKIALGVYCVIALFVVSANMPMDSWNFPNFQAEGQEQVPGVSMAFARYNSLYHPFSDLYNGLIAPMEGYIYVIENAQDLYRFSMECNGSDSQTYLGLDYVLGNDIDFLSEVYQERYFRPVGFLPNPNYDAEKTDLENEAANVLAFQGTFDGQGFEISNLMLEPIMDSTVFQNVFQSNLRYYSMFSIVGENGIIKNLGLIDPVLRQFLDFYQKIEYASVLAGANHGHIDHVYVIDKRPGTTSGHIVSETIRLSGIISVNYHSFNEAFVSALRINASGITPASTRVVLDENAGEAISNVYYDSTVYLNQSPDLAEPVPHDTETIDFQDSSFFDASWFFNNSYLSANNPNNIYPILKGFTREDAFLDIDSAADLVYLSKMMDKSLGFQDLSYRIAGDIDMAMVSRTVYQTPVTPFSGVLAGRLTSTDVSKIRYTREIGDNDFFTILNLSMTKGTDLGTFVGYGLFGILTGTVQNLNIFGTILSMNDHETFVENENFLAAGVVASHLKGGSINTVLIETETTLPAGEMNKVFIGGFVGLGNGTITASASEGLIVGGTHSFVPKSKDSALGGFIGYAGVPGETGIYLTLTSSTNGIDIIGPGFSGTPDSLVSLGGFVGSGSMNPMTNLVNNGNLFSHAPGTAIASVFMGGVIGYQIMMANNTTNNIINNGDLTLVVNRQTQARLAAGYGVGANQLSTSSRTYTNLTNYGHILFDIPSEKVFTEAELRGMDIQIAGILIGYYFASTLNRLINNADLSIDLSLVQACAGLVIANNNYYNGSTEPDYRWKYNDLGDKVSGTISLYRSYNAGLITAITSNPVYAKQIKIAGVVLGKSIHMYSLRNEKEIKVTISHDSPDALESASPSDGLLKQEKNIIIVGVAEEVSSGRRGSELYNGGNLSFFSEKTKDIKFHLFLSGVVHRTKNVTITTTGNIVKTLLNDGYLFVDAGLTGDIRVSGIANTVAGAVQSAINTGDLFVKNEMKPTETDDYLLDAAGISTLMIGNSLTTSFLANVLNYGDIVAYSSTANGRALAAGILARNNRREDFTNRTSNSTYKYINAAIRNSINYGNVYAWNERSETAGTVERLQVEKEVFAIAAGVLGYGMLRIENVINYGDIYSKTLAGGIVGHLDKYSFARFYSTAEFTLANLVNYGSIRQITEAGAFSFDSVTGIGQHPAFINSAFIRSGSTAFGGILGNIYVGDQTWNFSTGYYAVSPDTWRHWLNFDQVSDVVGNQPGPDGMDEVLAGMLVSNLYAVKLKDDSLYPFLNIRSFSLDDAPLTLDDGVDGTTYSGVFDSSFAFKNPPESTPPILNNIQFIPIERVNAVLSAKIWPTLPPGVKGIYALGPSTGIGEQGLYLPDQFPLDDLNRYQGTSAWRDVVVSGNESLNFKVRYGMKQLSLSLSTNIDNAQLVDDLANPTLHILNPVIDQVHNIMTFYVAENSIFTADSHKNRTDQLCYLKASAALMGYPGVHEIAGVWYGNYNYDNQLGTYVSTQDGTHVQINVTLFDYGTFDPKHFYVDTAHSSTYSLGYHASFFYVANDSDTSVFLPSTIQNSFGPYDLENNIYAQDGTLADSVDEHAGMIRVFSEAYVFNPENPMEDPMTFRDYKVRIVRLREASFTALGAVTVDGIDALPETIPDVEDITISAPINFKPVANTSIGKMILTYVTENVAFGAVPHTLIQLLDQNQNVLGMTGRYSITPVNKQTIGNRDAVTGLWNPSTMEYTFTINQALPAGNYTLKITVDPERIYLVKFSKKMSTDAILTLTSTSHAIVQSGNDFSTDIPYGLFYNPEDPDVNATRIVNFTNLESVQNIAAEALNYPSVRPDYLTGMVLSNFATLVSTAFSMNLIEDEDEGYIRHEYVITYVVRPEEGPDITYTHTITEGVVPPELSASFLGVNPIIPVTGTLAFKRADPPPSYRFEYALSTVYRFGNVGLISKFTYSGEGSPFLGVHYAMATENNGFKIDIYSVSPVGFYQIAFSYVNERAFSGIDNPLDGQTLLWDFDFQSVLIEKQGSNVSRLENILFATDAAYEGMNTILHTSIMNEDLYVYLDENPDQRVIQWAPTFDIQYPEGDTSRLYYAIGQVADTDLTYYRPNFTLPEGAWIKRIVTVDNQEMIVDELFADFSPLIENEFRYVHYRIFAEDYNEEYLPNSTYSTDYWVAVQDVTNNIYLEVEINMNADIPLPITFLTLILTNEEGDVTRMSLFSEFQMGVILGTNLPFRPTSSGVVQVFMDLPKAYVFTVTFNRTLQSGPGFTIPGSIIPRMYTVVIDIDDQIGSQEWGQQEIVPFRP